MAAATSQAQVALTLNGVPSDTILSKELNIGLIKRALDNRKVGYAYGPVGALCRGHDG